MIQLSELDFQPLDNVDSDIIRGFSCGNLSIDGYLKNEYNTRWDHRIGITSTTVILYQGMSVAFFTSCCTQVKIDEAEARELGMQILYVPAVEVKFFAVHQSYQGRGIGKHVIEMIIGEVYNFSQKFACRYIFLWSVPTEQALAFYKKRFFEDTGQTNYEGLRLMMFLIPDRIDLEDGMY